MENSVLEKSRMTRRKFLWLTSMSVAGFAVGCAVDPVTGERELMLVSEAQEIQLDKENSPHQFSSDYGVLQDRALNNYISQVGKTLAARTHRPKMPYSFQGVNATYVNAYAFPGGSIAATRGILLNLKNEAELAGLLGHELGHVNARHTAEQMSKSTLISGALSLGQMYLSQSKYAQYTDLANQLGSLGAGALLASYSRDNEREADALGNEYLVKAGYSPMGFVGLMNLLKNMSNHKSNAVELLFATHPMSDERYRTAVETARTTYQSKMELPTNRERYMDQTAKLRAVKDAIEDMQKGESAMAQQKYPQAETFFQSALKQVPTDYAGLLMMSKCLLAQQKNSEALRYAEKAKRINPGEAQSFHLSGFAKIRQRNYDAAYQDFRNYDRLLPGNPNMMYFKGLALDGMGRKQQAAAEYTKYLQVTQQGAQAKQAYQRLVQWGYIKPEKK
jgi:predicted Zn-dependent protease